MSVLALSNFRSNFLSHFTTSSCYVLSDSSVILITPCLIYKNVCDFKCLISNDDFNFIFVFSQKFPNNLLKVLSFLLIALFSLSNIFIVDVFDKTFIKLFFVFLSSFCLHCSFIYSNLIIYHIYFLVLSLMKLTLFYFFININVRYFCFSLNSHSLHVFLKMNFALKVS